MQDKPKVSVIIPVFNTAKYLPRCLDSVLRNTYGNLEVICVNDGSTDDSAVILERYAAADSRVIVVNKVNEGVSVARNTGLDLATGSYIAFIDSDDWVHPQYLEVLLHCQNMTDADIVACSYEKKDTETTCTEIWIERKKINPARMTVQQILQHSALKRLVWGRIYSREVLKENRFVHSLTWGEDTVFNLTVLLDNEEIDLRYIDIPLYFYFSRESSLSNTRSYNQKIELPQWCIDNYHIAKQLHVKKLFLEQGIKDILAYRYAEMFAEDKRSIRESSRKLISKGWTQMCYSHLFSNVELLKYRVLLSFPFIYRAFRIIDDRTLIDWERGQKRKRREACKKR